MIASRRCAKLPAPPRRAGRKLRPGRLDVPLAGRLDVCLVADPEPFANWERRILQAPGRKGRSRGCRLAPALASGARALSHRLVENEQRIRQAARNVRRFLETAPENSINVVPYSPPRPLNAVWFGLGRGFFGTFGRKRPRSGRTISPWLALKVGLAGLGTVGASVVRLIEDSAVR